MRNCGRRGRSRNLMLAPNLLPKAVPHSGSRLLLGLIVRPDRRLVEGRPPLGHTPPRPSRPPERPGGPDAGDPRPVAALSQRARLLALRVGAPAPLLPYVVLPRPTQPAHSSPGARVAPLAAGFRRGSYGTFGGLPRDGHYPHPGHREGEGFSQGAFRRPSKLRTQRLQDRVGIRLQGGPRGGPRGRDHRFRAGRRGLGREAHRRRPHSFRPPRSVPGRQGLHGARVGAAVDGALRSARCGRPEKRLPQGVVEGRSALGLWQAPDHRRGHRPTQGLLLSGASSCEDVGRAADAPGRQGRGLHLRTTDQRLSRPTAAPPGGSARIAHCTSVVLEDVWLSELSRLLPELKERYPDLPSSPLGDREMAKGALFEAITRLVGTLASRAPVVLFLDDLEWADAATLEVLDYAGRHWAEQGAPVLLLIAARPEEPEAGSTFERWLSSLGRRLPVRSLTLGPLGNEDVKGLLWRLARSASKPAGAVEEPVGSDEAEPGLGNLGEWLAAETGGQPFYLVETLKALLEEGELVVRSRADEKPVVEVGPSLRAGNVLRDLLPQSVREVIRARLSRLSFAASELLRAGAVLERGFGFEPLVSVTGLGEAEGLRGLDELIERRLLREETGGQEAEKPLLYPSATYSFSHEKIRQVAYTEGGPARRQVLHRRAFEVLEGSGAPPAELARHALAGGLAKPYFSY